MNRAAVGCSGAQLPLPDGLEEAAQLPDVDLASVGGWDAGGKVGQVALEHDPGERLRSVDPCLLQVAGEPGHRGQAAADGLEPDTGGQPLPGPPFGRLTQPRLGDPGEVEGEVAGIAEPAQLPYLARVLGHPAAAGGEVGDPLMGVHEQATAVAVASPGRGERLTPGPLVPVAQAGNVGLEQERHEAPYDLRRCPAGTLVVPTLDDVGQLPAQRLRQPGQDDHLVRGNPERGELTSEHHRVRAPVRAPRAVVGVT